MGNVHVQNQTINVGYWAAFALKPGAAPLHSYVGQVQAVDDRGIRITLVNWVSGSAAGYDLFLPWSNIQSALVATPEHDIEGFHQEASRWQTNMHGDSVQSDNRDK